MWSSVRARGLLLAPVAGLLGLAICVGGCGSSDNGNNYHHKKSTPTPTVTASPTPTATPTPSARGLVWAVQDSGNSITGYSLTDLESGGNISPVVTISGTSTGLDHPECAALDHAGNLWVPNFSSNAIVEFAAADLATGGDLTPVVTITGTSTELDGPVGCAFDSSGNLWIADFNGSFAVEAFSPSNLAAGGNVPPAVTISGSSTDLCAPQEITFDSAGNLWVANFGWICGSTSPNLAEYQKSDLATGGDVPPAVLISGSSTGFNAPNGPGPFGLAFDSSGNLWASPGNTVEEFAAADLVSGGNVPPKATISGSNTQMNEPSGIAFDSQGNLWAPQFGSQQVTGYSAGDLTGTGTLNLTPFSVVSGVNTGINGPKFILFKTTDLAVPDYFDNRVLIYKPPFSNGEAASKVIGQASFTTNASGLTQSTLHNPSDAATDPSGNGWVSDTSNSRVLEFTPPFTTGMNASVVLGQSDFTSSGCTTTSTGLCVPFAVTSDASGDIWVADDGNCRVLEYKSPFTTGMAASVVLGEPDFTTKNCTPTQATLDCPNRLTFDASGDLWVSDVCDNRVLEFTPPFTNGMNASVVLGQSNFTSNAAATTSTGLSSPLGVSFDSSGNLWVADANNCRALEYEPTFTNGMAASLVLGEPNFTTASCGSGAANVLGNAGGVAVDSSGNLWVSDMGNARVLEFSPPFSNGMNASLVIGQTDFTGSSCDQGGTPGADTLCMPEGLTIGGNP